MIKKLPHMRSQSQMSSHGFFLSRGNDDHIVRSSQSFIIFQTKKNITFEKKRLRVIASATLVRKKRLK